MVRNGVRWARAMLIWAIFGLATAASAQHLEIDRPALAITQVTVIDTVAGAGISDRTVLIEDDRIVGVEPSGGIVPEDAKVIDGRGAFLIPGLWDMHVHLSYARESAVPALVANGVTGVRDLGSHLAEIDRWRARIEEGARIGPTILRTGPMLNDSEFNVYQLAVADAAEARAAVRTLHKVGVDLIKQHRRTSREAYFALVEEAARLGLPFAGHIPMTVTPTEASEAGQASIEHAETLFEGTFATEHAAEDFIAAIANWRTTEASALFETFAANGTMVTPTLVAQTRALQRLASEEPHPHDRYIARSAHEEAERTLSEMLPQAEAILAELEPLLRELSEVTGMMSAAGVKLLTGTDLSFLHAPGFSLHEELALLVEAGVSPADALRAATLHPGELFPEQRAGTVAPGMRADLVLLDADPLENVENTQRIRAVVLRGRYLDRDELDELLRRAEEMAATQ